MAAVLEAIGLISGVLGIIQFGIDNLPKEDSVGSTIRVTVGLDLGEFGDITVDHNHNSWQQATYAPFSANNDAISIAYASITWLSGDRYAWVGDWGGYQHQTGFQAHLLEFANIVTTQFPKVQKTSKPKHRSLSNKDVSTTRTSYGTPKHPLSARFQPTRHYPQDNQTTMPSLMGVSLDFCKSATSFGPDFLNVQSGIFCRMSDKTTWPVCDAVKTTDNCFSDLNQLVINGVAARDKPYSNVVD
ncbi:hypothetical protein F5B21DRAFT_516857 [Xylaria acuta]|nr:hypothetical protein F5B21DRAFT_516857 [Xylaria acuta]